MFHRLVFLSAGAVAAMLSTDGARAEEPVADATGKSEWTFAAAPYVWASGISGQAGIFGMPPQNVDASFGDILEELDFGFMGAAEARNGRLSFSADLVYAKIGAGVATPIGVLATSIDAKIQTFMATALVGYDVSSNKDSRIDLVGGARFWSVSNDFNFVGGALGGTTASDGDTWVDPILGVKFRSKLGPGWYASGWALAGGFGAASDSVWDVMAGVGYELSDRTSLFAGYRVMDVDYSSGGFVYDVTQKGPVFGGVFRF